MSERDFFSYNLQKGFQIVLIRFTVENFLSFKDEVEFSMVAGRPRMHPNHIYRVPKRKDLRLLKTGVIYGANASGKSNLIAAMSFARWLIVRSANEQGSIPVTPFRLDKNTEGTTSKFQFEIWCSSGAYNYGFELDTDKIHSEWLYEMRPRSEKLLFERTTDDDGYAHVDFGRLTFNKIHGRQFMRFLQSSTRADELFLKKTVDNNVSYFADVYDWFNDQLRLIFPDSYTGVETAYMSESEFEEISRDIIELFDLGIDSVRLKPSDIAVPPELKQAALKALREVKQNAIVQFPINNTYQSISAENDVRTRKFMSVHQVPHEDREVEFELSQESDGTRRLFELSTALLGLLIGLSDRVYVIDEIDRSLHPHMTNNILDIFLANSEGEPSQLIVTTHESSLLDLDLLRRDEIWFIEKDRYSASSVYSLEEFAPRYDTDVKRGYLNGRYGAIPIIPGYNVLEWAKN